MKFLTRYSRANSKGRVGDGDDKESGAGRAGLVSGGRSRSPASIRGPTPDGGHPPSRTGVRKQLRAFWTMAAPYFRQNHHGRLLFASTVVLTLANSAVRVFFSYLHRDLWNALSDMDAEKFYEIMTQYAWSLVLLAPINVAYRFQRQKLAIAWRDWMTGRVLQLYFTNKVYYALERRSLLSSLNDVPFGDYDEVTNKSIDNPDQRIAEDIRSFTEFSLAFFLELVTSVIDLASFSYILFSIMPELFLAIFLFASIGTVLTICIGKVLIRLNYESLQKEANFRFSMVRVRENSESIAFYAGEAVEEKETRRRLTNVIDVMSMINVAERNLDFFTTFYGYATYLLPIVVVAPEYLAGNVELGAISQAKKAFSHILGDLSIVVNNFTELSKFSAGIDRLFYFMSAIAELNGGRSLDSLLSMPVSEEASSTPEINNKNTIEMTELDPFVSASSKTAPPTMLRIRGLRLVTPDQRRVLVQNLTLTLASGNALLIVGASGSGKSSLLRVIAGLWNAGKGEIMRPNSEHVYFLPQRPYCPPGSLRDQLLYPSSLSGRETCSEGAQRPVDEKGLRKVWTDDDLLEVLKRVDLPFLATQSSEDGNPYGGLDAVLDWSNTLSLGEQQRLAFGRLIVNRPKLVIMDESTSALDVAAEKKMYTLLKEMSGEGGTRLTYMSVGHRPTLLAHHNLKLTLREGAGHVSEISAITFAADEGLEMV